MKKLKSALYPLLVLALLLALVGIGLGLFQFTVWIEPPSPEISSTPLIKSPVGLATDKLDKPSPVLPTVSPSLPTSGISPSKNPKSAPLATNQGTLRVSNPTEHSVRLALLARRSPTKAYAEPAHWDFAPMEGGSKGLILSLPQGNLKLSKGDILVAFAQDGSRLYWGPYVVGETPLPMWNQQAAEWQLTLQP